MALRPFEMHRPSTLAEATDLLGELGPESALYAGGTELLLAMKEGLLRPSHLIDIKRLPLSRMAVDPERSALHIGATIKHREIELSPVVAKGWPALREMESRLANVRVRNQGTLGGNLAFNEPHADPGTVLMLYGARVVLAESTARREVPVERFLKDPFVTDLRAGELLVEIVVPPAPRSAVTSYVRFSVRERPIAGVAAMVIVDEGSRVVRESRVVVGAVGPRPQFAVQAARELSGATAEGGPLVVAVDRAAASAATECEVIPDAYGSEDYKRALVRALVRRVLLSISQGVASIRRAGRSGR